MQTNALPPASSQQQQNNQQQQATNPAATNQNGSGPTNPVSSQPAATSPVSYHPDKDIRPSDPGAAQPLGQENKSTVEINTTQIKEPNPTVKVNFLKPNTPSPNAYMAAPTKPYDDTQPLKQFVQSVTQGPQNNAEGKQSLEYFQSMYLNMFNSVNLVVSHLCKMFAGDSSTKDYAMPKDGIDGMADMWARWKNIHQKKGNDFWTLFCSSAVFIVVPFVTAWANRSIFKETQKNFLKQQQEDAKKEADRIAASNKKAADDAAARKAAADKAARDLAASGGAGGGGPQQAQSQTGSGAAPQGQSQTPGGAPGVIPATTTAPSTTTPATIPPPPPSVSPRAVKEDDNPLTTMVEDGKGGVIPLYEKLGFTIESYVGKFGFTYEELTIGKYKTSTGKEYPIKFKSGIPQPKVGGQKSNR